MHAPNLDEIWSTPTGEIGVVSDIRAPHVTFLSLTGVRATVQWRAALDWKRTNDRIPATANTCPRQGCKRQAFLAYERDSLTELICAYHAPRGVQLRVTNLERPFVTRPWYQCESCKYDGYEVLGELQQYHQPPNQSRLWACRFCVRHWAIIEVPHTQVLTALTAVLSIPCGYRLDGDFTLESINPDSQKTYRLPLRNDGPRAFRDSRPMTFADYLKDY